MNWKGTLSAIFTIPLTIVIVSSNDNDINNGLCSLSLLCFSILAAPEVRCSNITVPTGSKNEKITCIIDADPEVDHAVWLWNATDGRKTLGLGQTHEMIYSSYRNVLVSNNNNNGPNGHLFYVGGDLMMRRGMLPVIMLPDGDLRIVLHLVPFWILTIWGECSHNNPMHTHAHTHTHKNMYML